MDVQQVLTGAQDAMAAKRVYGEPYEKNGITVIPAAAVGGGGGGGSDTTGNGGGGFGIIARPAGAWIIKGESVRWQPAVDATKVALMGQVVAIVAILTLRSVLKHRSSSRTPALPKFLGKYMK
jgi:uncharacterized spore protein YtfJ